MKAVCKPRVFLQLLDRSAAQAVTFETTTRHDKGTSLTTGDARPVYSTVGWSQAAPGISGVENVTDVGRWPPWRWLFMRPTLYRLAL